MRGLAKNQVLPESSISSCSVQADPPAIANLSLVMPQQVEAEVDHLGNAPEQGGQG